MTPGASRQDRHRRDRRCCCLLSGLALAGTWLAFLLPLIGARTCSSCALIPDEVGVVNRSHPGRRSTRSTTRAHLSATGSRRPAARLEVVPAVRRRRGARPSTATPACWSSAARWAPTTTRPAWIGPVKELIRDAVAERRADPRHLPRPPADRAPRWAARVDAQPARPAGRAARRSAGPTRRAGDRLFGRLATPAARRAVELRRRRRAARRARGPRRDRPTARCRSPASARAPWGVQLHPEVDEAIVGAWVPTPSGPSSPSRGIDAGRAARARSRRPAPSWTTRWRAARRRASPTAGPASDPAHEPARPPTKGNLTRLGFHDPEPRRAAPRRARATPPSRCVALLARTADPDLALGRAGPAGRGAPTTAGRCSKALVDDEGTAMRLLCVLGASEALADHLCRHPEHWRELTDPTLGSTRPAAYAVRGGLLRAVGADPARPGARPPPCPTPRRWTRCGWSTAGCCSAWPPATSTHHLGGRRRRRRAGRPRRRHPRRGAGDRPAAGRASAAHRPGWPWSRWASAAATSSTTSPTST